MAQFRAQIQGQRGGASRLGSKASGLTVHANGWNAGVTVRATHVDGKDMFRVYVTSGSGYGGRHELIAEIVDGDVTLGESVA
jgi:hypothetical protein